jgi:membrane dipeptidase
MIVDTHNDLLTEIEFFESEERPFERRWREQLRRGGVGLQVCPVFVGRERLPEGALRQALRQVAACHRAVRESDAVLVRTRDDLVGLDPERRLGLMLSMEGAEPFGHDPVLADVFWELGVRMVSFTWNDRNAFADGAGESTAAGLSRLGRELLDRLVGLGVILDLAHASENLFWEVLERSAGAPVIVSHASCRAVYDTPRNLSDGQLRALAERGAVLGLMAHPLVVDPARPTLERFIDHIEHAVSVMGAEHVGLGSDFIRQVALSGAIGDPGNALLPDGMALSDAVEDFEGPADYPALAAGLRARGYDGDRLAGILGGNFLRVFAGALPAGVPATSAGTAHAVSVGSSAHR